ncbi:MAG: LemA family protein [Rickettsiales bacterium]|jgi:LemA protein|nr:LemA family protein [Rickettsiales bacterium]
MTAQTYVIIAAGAILLYLVGMYNSLIRKKSQVEEAWSTIDTQLKRRYDLIPNLVETVKGYAKHESATLEAVIKARNAGMDELKSRDVDGVAKAEKQLSRSLGSIFALGESYPALKANESFVELQRELSDTETKIQAARQFYNTCVLSLNTATGVFPSSVVAGMFGFGKAKYFEIDEAEKKNVKVGF